jgi:hypothetical protein
MNKTNHWICVKLSSKQFMLTGPDNSRGVGQFFYYSHGETYDAQHILLLVKEKPQERKEGVGELYQVWFTSWNH